MFCLAKLVQLCKLLLNIFLPLIFSQLLVVNLKTSNLLMKYSENKLMKYFFAVSIPGKVSSFASVPTLPPITNTVPEFHCNFDAGLCGMIQDDLDNLDYLRIQGETPSKGTGPFRDHTTGKGS